MGRNTAGKDTNQHRNQRMRKVTVQTATTLLAFLFDLLKGQSKSSVKSLLSHRQISVNGKVATQFDAPLEPNDIVGISYEHGKPEFNHPELTIVWEDDDLIVVNKKDGLLSVASLKEKEKNAFSLLKAYVKKADLRNKIFTVHRLDRGVSGLMLFVKNKHAQDKLQLHWNKLVHKYEFVGVVEGQPEKNTGMLTSLVTEDPEARTFITVEGKGSEVFTRYKVLRTNGNYSLLVLSIDSGRKNQIRTLLAQQGYPIAGDAKNKAQTSPASRLMLHSGKLHFTHPVTGKEMQFEVPMPSSFRTITKKQ
jgi:23S rRNA pseudouridine1911/1915/1917 synthase